MSNLAVSTPSILVPSAGRIPFRPYFVVGFAAEISSEFDRQYVNLRPVRLFPRVPCPLAGKTFGDIDFYVVRENTEGEYSSLGGRVNEGTEHEVVIQESVFTRRGVDRILRYAFELAQSRPRKR